MSDHPIKSPRKVIEVALRLASIDLVLAQPLARRVGANH